MDGIPRLPMLKIDLKTTKSNIDFKTPIKMLIKDIYHEDAESYNKECSEIESLRESAVINTALDFTGLQTLKKYYCQLKMIMKRFPLTIHDPITIHFEWFDFMRNSMAKVNDICFEQANVLYNIGALHVLLGGMDNRVTEDGMKISCTHFQCAAWAFQHLQHLNVNDFYCLDFNNNLLAFYHLTMLGQAQECLLEKSMSDLRKPSTISRIAVQVSDYHATACRHLEFFLSSNSVKNKAIKEWKILGEMKVKFYSCIAFFYAGTQAQMESRYGDAVAYMGESKSALELMIKEKKVSDGSTDESLSFLIDIVNGKYNSLKKDNDLVYHDKIRSLDALPVIEGASLVKAISIKTDDPEVSGKDIFKRLVPFKVHENSSIYSEEKAKLLRSVQKDIDIKNDDITKFLSMLGLSLTEPSGPKTIELPDELLEKCAILVSNSKRDVVKELTSSMNQLSNKAIEVEGDLNKALHLIEIISLYLMKYEKPGLKDECDLLKLDANELRATLSKTSKTNEDLHKLMTGHVGNLKLLTSPLENILLALKSMQYVPTEKEEKDLETMNQLVGKVKEMLDQRVNLQSMLRQQIQEDDITEKFISNPNMSCEDLMRKELEKHTKLIKLIEQNLAAQSNIKNSITEITSEFVPIRRKIDKANKIAQNFIDSLIRSFEVFNDLMSKSKEGINFYCTIEKNVSSLLSSSENLHENHIKVTGKGDQKVRGDEEIEMLKSKLESLKTNIEEKQGKKLKDYLSGMGHSSHNVNSQPSYNSTSIINGHPSSYTDSHFNASSYSASSYTTGSSSYSLSTAPYSLSQTPTLTSFDSKTTLKPREDPRSQAFKTPQPASGSESQKQLDYQQNPMQMYQSQNAQAYNMSNYQGGNYQPGSQVGNYQSGSQGENYPSSSQRDNFQSGSQGGNFQSGSQGRNFQSGSQGENYQSVSQGENFQLGTQGGNFQSVSVPQSATNSPHHNPALQYSQLQSYMEQQYMNSRETYEMYSQQMYNDPSEMNFSSYHSQQYDNHQEQKMFDIKNMQRQEQFFSGHGYHNLLTQRAENHINFMKQENSRRSAQRAPQSSGYLLEAKNIFPSYDISMSNRLMKKRIFGNYSSSIMNKNGNNIDEPNQMLHQDFDSQQHPAVASSQSNICLPSQNPLAHQPPHNLFPQQPPSNVSLLSQQYIPPQANIPPPPQQNQLSHQQQTKLNIPPTQPHFNKTPQHPHQPNLYSLPQQPPQNLLQKVHSQNFQQIPSQQSQFKQQQIPPQHLNYSQQKLPSTQPFQPSVPQQNGVPPCQQTPINFNQLSSFSPQHQSPVNFSHQLSYQPYPSPIQPPPPQQPLPQHSLEPLPQQPLQPQSQQPASQSILQPIPPTQLNQPFPQQNTPTFYQQSSQHKPQQNLLDSTPSIEGPCPVLPFSSHPRATGVSQGQLAQQVQPQQDNSNLSQQNTKLPQQNTDLPLQNTTLQQQNATQMNSNLQLNTIMLQQNTTLQAQSSHCHTRKSSSASLDEILSNGVSASNPITLLQPKVLTAEDLKKQRREDMRRKLKSSVVDPYVDSAKLQNFVVEVEKLKKHVENLSVPHLNKTSLLDTEWKELSEHQDKGTKSLLTAIARCYTLKNRCPDFMPFDQSRVKLLGSSDDYINASFINNPSYYCPDVIVTQNPLQSTIDDFLQMIYDYHVEIVVMITSVNELSQKNLPPYWPQDKKNDLKTTNFQVSLHSIQHKESWSERILYVSNNKTNLSRSVMQLQYTHWPLRSEPTEPESLLSFIEQVHSMYLQQRSLMRPIVVHCNNGSGRTGSLLALYNVMVHASNGEGVMDVVESVKSLRLQRKNMVEWSSQLLFVYKCFLVHLSSILQKYGILNTSPTHKLHLPFHKSQSEEQPRKTSLPKAAEKHVSTTDTTSDTATKPANPQSNVSTDDPAVGAVKSGITETTTDKETDNNTPQNVTSITSSLPPTSLPTSSSSSPNVTSPPTIASTTSITSSSSTTLSLHELQNPDKFYIDMKTQKKKITKANFFSQAGKLCSSNNNEDCGDPLDSLDPLWSMH